MTSSKKVIARIKGGLGNQLFCYAAARRLALVNDAELVIDDVTGFIRDHAYRRQCALHRFAVVGRRATPAERLEPFERVRRGFAKWISRRKPFEQRFYIEQDGNTFEDQLLTLRFANSVYLDGYWQSQDYFKDHEVVLRQDLKPIPPTDDTNRLLAAKIQEKPTVALHVRWFDAPGSSGAHNASAEYYRRAISILDAKLGRPQYFLFSDDPVAAQACLKLEDDRVTAITNNRGDENAYADMWLMTLCDHFITANSTFSWWGAWLGTNAQKIVVSPASQLLNGTITTWNFPRQLPPDWFLI